jgi:hypothetical protein
MYTVSRLLDLPSDAFVDWLYFKIQKPLDFVEKRRTRRWGCRAILAMGNIHLWPFLSEIPVAHQPAAGLEYQVRTANIFAFDAEATKNGRCLATLLSPRPNIVTTLETISEEDKSGKKSHSPSRIVTAQKSGAFLQTKPLSLTRL